MTYYSDMLIVIGELEALERGQATTRSAPELRRLCKDMLAIDPGEPMARQLLDSLESLPEHVRRGSLHTYLVEKVRLILRAMRHEATPG